MNRNLFLLVLISLVFGGVLSTFTPSKDTLFFDDFQHSTPSSKWVKSQFSEADVAFRAADDADDVTDIAMILPTAAKRYAVTSVLKKPIDNKDSDLIVQYEVRLQKGLECGGAYIKLYEARDDFDATTVDGKTPYSIMFGPDKCGNDNRIHFIVRHKNPVNGVVEEKLITAKPPVRTDKLSHVYTLHIRPDNTFTISVDRVAVLEGSFHEQFTPAFNPPKEIDDPTDSKPSDWVDEPKMADPSASKPDDWDEEAPAKITDASAFKPSGWLDNEPELVPDVTVTKPEEWDDEEDGDWEAPLVANPKCEDGMCGVWRAPLIANPAYKGKWSAPQIDNPAYKGEWKARQIANPNYFEEANPYHVTKIGAVGVEVWTTTDSILFDNFIITHDKQEAERLIDATWEPRHALEKQREAEREAEEANRLQGSFVDQAKFYAEFALAYAKAEPVIAAATLIGGILPIILCLGCFRSKKPVVQQPRVVTDSKPTEQPSVEEETSSDDDEKEEEEKEEKKPSKSTPVKRTNKVK